MKQKISRTHRHARVRKKVQGSAERPRLCVFRSINHIYAQVIDDSAGCTLASASSLQIHDQAKGKNKTQVAEMVGTLVAQNALAAQIDKVVLDRGGYQFHGRIKALAEAARAAGLVF